MGFGRSIGRIGQRQARNEGFDQTDRLIGESIQLDHEPLVPLNARLSVLHVTFERLCRRAGDERQSASV